MYVYNIHMRRDTRYDDGCKARQCISRVSLDHSFNVPFYPLRDPPRNQHHCRWTFASLVGWNCHLFCHRAASFYRLTVTKARKTSRKDYHRRKDACGSLYALILLEGQETFHSSTREICIFFNSFIAFS